MSQLFIGPPKPSLTPIDKKTSASKIVFQFRPLGMQEDRGNFYGSANTHGRENPILQFNHGEQIGWSFNCVLYAERFTDDVQPKLDALKEALKRDPKLKRPPLYSFVWGKIINEVVVVQSLGNIQYTDVRPDGTIRGASLPIKLLKYTQTDLEVTDPNKPPPSTFYVQAKDGDMWEHIAGREYGDPLIGDILRRLNPALPVPGDKPGTTLALLPAERFADVEVEPYSIPLQRTAAGLARRQKFLDMRSVSKTSTIIKVT